MKIWIATRTVENETSVYAAVSRTGAIKHIVSEVMLDWWKEYNNMTDIKNPPYQKIYNEYVRVFGDEEVIKITHEEVYGETS